MIKAKGGSYIGTSISLSVADPAAKLLNLAGAGFFVKIGKKVDELELLEWQKLKNKAKKDGLDFTDHAAKRIFNRANRGITYEKVKDVFINGKRYWNKKTEQYIIVKGDIALPLSKSGNNKITTILTDLTQEFKNNLIIK